MKEWVIKWGERYWQGGAVTSDWSWGIGQKRATRFRLKRAAVETCKLADAHVLLLRKQEKDEEEEEEIDRSGLLLDPSDA